MIYEWWYNEEWMMNEWMMNKCRINYECMMNLKQMNCGWMNKWINEWWIEASIYPF